MYKSKETEGNFVIYYQKVQFRPHKGFRESEFQWWKIFDQEFYIFAGVLLSKCVVVFWQSMETCVSRRYDGMKNSTSLVLGMFFMRKTYLD
jgi:hypothetical protein